MEQELITFDTGVLAKEKGFNIPCDTRWWKEDWTGWKTSKQGAIKCDNSGSDSISRPTQALLQQWFRITHNIDVEPYLVIIRNTRNEELEQKFEEKEYDYKLIVKGIPQYITGTILYQSYEEALEVGLIEAFKKI